ncbi:hypothetical protein JCM8547_006190, partial [Rhodosporidiobolus lusitaniae]
FTAYGWAHTARAPAWSAPVPQPKASHLTRLEIIGPKDDQVLNATFGYLPEPSLLKKLVLDGNGKIPLSLSSLTAKFNDLVALDSLTLSDRVDLACPAFFSSLRRIGLKHLTFGRGVDLTSTFVLTLVKGDNKLPLERLTLSFLKARAGPAAEDCSYDPWDFEEDWRPPRWPLDFQRDKLEELIEVAEEAGIKVDGTAVDARQVEDEYLEQRRVIEEYLRETGDKREKGWLDESDDDYAPSKSVKRR